MVFEDYVISIIAKRIAGDIVFSNDPPSSLRKWREYFEINQVDLAKHMRVSPSVVSDYEKGRRAPGVRFVQRYVSALIEIDKLRGWRKISDMAASLGIIPGVVMDMMEFSKPLTIEELVEAVKGIYLTPEIRGDRLIYGYTLVDSIKAILTLSGIQYSILFGMTPERAIIFTKVHAGRSPLVAVRVSPVKPSVVVLHGPRDDVDPLAVEIARRDNVPLILSLAGDIEELRDLLRMISSKSYPQST